MGAQSIFTDGTVGATFGNGGSTQQNPDGTVIERRADGTQVMHSSEDGVRTALTANGRMQRSYVDGTVVECSPDGRTVQRRPDGSRAVVEAARHDPLPPA